MITHENKREEVLSVGDELETIDGELSIVDLAHIFSILAKQYSDNYGSIVRELASNCYDANILNKDTKPIIVGFKEEDGVEYVFFQDFGSGMNPEFMKGTYMKWGKSTKSRDNTALGAFGIGSKSPLSIKQEYYIDSVCDGMFYSYIIYINEKGLPSAKVLLSYETEEPNGTTVKIQLDEELNERNKFTEAIKSQLVYFDSIYYHNNSSYYYSTFNTLNQFKLLKSNSFIISNNFSRQLHICYAKVYYPLDLNKTFITSNISLSNSLANILSNINIGLYFNIGELKVTPSRESIVYEKEYTDLIIERIKEALIKLCEIYNNRGDEYFKKTTLKDYFNSKEDEGTLTLNSRNISLTSLKVSIEDIYDIPFNNNKIYLEGLKVVNFDSYNFRRLFNRMYEVIDVYFKSKRYKDTNYSNYDWHDVSRFQAVYISDSRVIDKKVLNYLKKQHYEFVIIKKKSVIGFYSTFKTLFTAYSDKPCITYAKIAYDYCSQYTSIILRPLSSVEVPKVERVKVSVSIQNIGFKLNNLYVPIKSQREEYIKTFNDNTLYIIDTDDKAKILESFADIIRKKDGRFKYIKVYSCNKTTFRELSNYKIMSNSKNIINLNEFAKHKLFGRIATAFYIRKSEIFSTLLDSFNADLRYPSDNRYRNEKTRVYIYPTRVEHEGIYSPTALLKYLNKDTYDDFEQCVRYFELNSIYINDSNVEFVDSCIEIANHFKVLDYDIISKYNRVKRFYDKVELIFHTTIHKDNLKYVIEYMKTMKKHLSPEHYDFLYGHEIEFYNELLQKQVYLNSLKQNAA